MTRTIAAYALALGLGFTAARVTQPSPPPSPPPAHTGAPRPQEHRAQTRASLDSAALREIIRETLRQERAERGELERGPEVGEDADVAAAAAPIERPTIARDEAYDRGASILEAARTARQWRASDRHAMLGALAATSIPQREQLISRLFTMLNRGELRPVQGTPPI